MRRVLRHLRIVWTATYGILCVLMIIFWIRSYWRSDSVTTTQARYASYNGRLIYEQASWWGNQSDTYWELGRRPEGAPTQWFKTSGFVLRYPSVVAIPFWCPVLLLASVAAAPWVRWSTRFTLRTLVIATTLVAIVLALAVWAARN